MKNYLFFILWIVAAPVLTIIGFGLGLLLFGLIELVPYGR